MRLTNGKYASVYGAFPRLALASPIERPLTAPLMIIRLLRLLLICLCFSAAPLRASEPANRPTPGYVRVLLETTKGKIVVAVDLKRAPRTSRNFLAYVDDGRLDGTEFYRSARRKANPKLGYIQGGIRTNLRRALPPVAHEPTTVTDIKHLDATISMARVIF